MNKAGQGFVYATLSTANNSESDADFTTESGASARTRFSMFNSKNIAISSKTTYYMNLKTSSASVTDIRINETEGGQTSKAIIRAVCAYL